MEINSASCSGGRNVPVSVIIPCYCCADTIERAVDSVLAQTCLPAELWLVDDASNDNGMTHAALDVLRNRYGDLLRFEVISLSSNGGPSAARNAAWDRATQPLLAFLDADDVWHPGKLEIQYGWMADHPSAVLTAHAVSRFGDKVDFHLPSASEIAEYQDVWQVSPHRLLRSNCVPTRSVMVRREIPYRFEPAKRHSEDYLLWLQIVFDGHPVWRLELPLAGSFKAPYGEAGLTADLWKMEKGELDTYLRLYRQGRIKRVLLYGVSFFSLAKFARRWFIRLMSGRI